MTAIIFADADQLRDDLVAANLLGPRGSVPGPIFHLAEATEWAQAQQTGIYPWSTRGVTHLEQGYVHCSLLHQVEGVRAGFYADLGPDEMVLLEIDPARLRSPVIMEDLQSGQEFAHVYGPLDVDAVVSTGPVPRPTV